MGPNESPVERSVPKQTTTIRLFVCSPSRKPFNCLASCREAVGFFYMQFF